MIEKPIIFSPPMVVKILSGEKTQTRRILKFRNFDKLPASVQAKELPLITVLLSKEIGEQRWVRERFRYSEFNQKSGFVTVTYSDESQARRQIGIGAFVENTPAGHWRPSIFMHRWASRINIQITGCKIERLQKISRNDAIAEGIYYHKGLEGYVIDEGGRCFHGSNPIRTFEYLWQSINEKRGDWNSNPYVIVREFRRV
jgi:hypothetical protein